MKDRKRICPNCLDGILSWESDADASEVPYSEPGTVTYYSCFKCNAFIEVFVPLESDTDDKKDKG